MMEMQQAGRLRSKAGDNQVFCPRCAATNIDDAKFCRVCGTNLDTVALALSDPAAVSKATRRKHSRSKQKNWIDKRRDGTKNMTQGIGLITASALLGLALGLFSHNPDWIIIWLVFVGWVTVWGVVSITSGIGDLLESRFMRQQLGEDESLSDDIPATQSARIIERDTSPSLPASVTENTTKLLNEPEP